MISELYPNSPSTALASIELGLESFSNHRGRGHWSTTKTVTGITQSYTDSSDDWSKWMELPTTLIETTSSIDTWG